MIDKLILLNQMANFRPMTLLLTKLASSYRMIPIVKLMKYAGPNTGQK